ncbi:hypothetical protein AAYQ05_17375 [Flavobacterium sp. B11]|uniref:hypothetical protein n=1 Tax=Flavobacterium movens TaxID=214860 RepID=UPI0031D20672
MQISSISGSFWENKKKSSIWDRLFRRNKTVTKALTTPEIIGKNCQGLLLKNENIKSFLFSTDMALIENNDPDSADLQSVPATIRNNTNYQDRSYKESYSFCFVFKIENQTDL